MKKLVCARITSSNPSDWAEGSIFNHECASCGEKVVMGKAGQAVLKEPDISIICTECLIVEIPPGTNVEEAPGAFDEYLKFLRKRAH